MNRKLMLIAAVIIAFSGLAVAQEDFRVSQGVEGLNVIPRVATNTDTGDVLVVWTNQQPGTFTLTVWSRLYKRAQDGTFTPRPVRRVSNASGWNNNAFAVYVPWLKQYVVFWDTFNFFNGLTRGDIMARKLNRNGKTVGGIKTIVGDGRANNWPHATVTRDDRPGGGPGARNRLVLYYSAFPTDVEDKQGGLRFQQLRNNLNPRGASVLIERSEIDTTLVNSAADVSPAFTTDHLRPLVFVSDSESNWSGGFISYDLGGTTIKARIRYVDYGTAKARKANLRQFWTLNTSVRARFFYSPTIDLSTYSSYASEPATNTRRTLLLDRLDMALDTEPEFNRRNNFSRGRARIEWNTDPAAAQFVRSRRGWADYASTLQNRGQSRSISDAALTTKVIARWVYADTNKVKYQEINRLNNGKLRYKAPKNAFGHGGQLTWMEAAGIPLSDSTAIAWSKQINGTNQQIWLHILE